VEGLGVAFSVKYTFGNCPGGLSTQLESRISYRKIKNHFKTFNLTH
jgi:hypothetical protein